MNLTPRMEHGLLLFLILMILIPCGIIIFIAEEKPYYRVAADPGLPAAQLAGYTVTGVKDTSWNVTGAEGGKTITLLDPEGRTVTIATQAFSSAEARDAAIRRHNANAVGRGKQVGSLLVYGQYVMYVTPANHPVLRILRAGADRNASSP